MPVDLLEQKREPVDLLADEKGMSWQQGTAPSFGDKIFNLFSDPAKEKARAVNAIVDSESLGIRPDVAYKQKSAIDKYYQIRPENTKRREKVLSDIKRFNDMGGVEEEWHSVLLKNAKQIPYQMQIVAGGIMKVFEENPEGVYGMLGVTPTEEDLKTFQLVAEAREKKLIRTLSDEVISSGASNVQRLQPVVMPGGFKETAGMATQSALNNLIYLAPGMFMGRAIPLVAMGSQAFGQSYIEQREGGSDTSKAFLASLVKGGSEVATEFIPVGIYLKPKASFVRSLAASELTEIPTETVNQIVNDVTDKVTIRPDMTAEDAIDNIMTTIQVTALSTPGISGVTYSAHKVIGKALLLSEHKDTFDKAKNASLMDGATPQAAVKAGIDAVSETPEGAAFVESKVSELKKEATEFKAPENKQPFIFGVQEDANGEVTGFTMADPESGQTFDVPAMKSEDKEKMSIAPDAEAVKKAMAEIKEAGTMDAQFDRIIEGQEDIDEAAGQLFQDDIDEMGFVNEVFTEEDAKPETVLDRVKQINDRIGEKGSIDLEPLVNLGRSIWAEGHQSIEAFTARAKELLGDVWDKVQYHIQAAWKILNNERGSVNIEGVTTPKGTASDIPAKDKPQAEAWKDTSKWDNPEFKARELSEEDNIFGITAEDDIASQHNEFVKNRINLYKPPSETKFITPENIDEISSALTAAKEGKIDSLELRDIVYKNIPLPPEEMHGSGMVGDLFAGSIKDNIDFYLAEYIKGQGLKGKIEGDVINFDKTPPVPGSYYFRENPDLYDSIIKGFRNNPTKILRDILKDIKVRIEEDQATVDIFNKYYGKGGEFDPEAIARRNAEEIQKRRDSFKLIKPELPNPTRPPEVGGQTLYSGVDPTQIIPVLKSLTNNIQEAMPHLEALGLKAYESGKSTFEAWSAEMKSYLGDLWESFKGAMAQVWESVKKINDQIGERGSFSTKKVTTEDINMMLSAAARQDAATGGNITPESYLDLRAQAAQKAFSVIEKKMTRAQRREAAALARQGEADARLMPTYSAMSHIVNAGGMSLKSLQADYDGDTIRELMNRRPGLVSKKSTIGPDVFADEHGFESGDDMINAILDWKGLKAEGKAQSQEFLDYYEKAIGKADFEAYREEFDRQEQKALDDLTKRYKPKAAKGIKKEIRRRTGQAQAGDRMVTEYDALTEAFRKEANTARRAFAEGKQEEIERSKEVMRWLVRRWESLKNVRDYFGLTDAEMMQATRRRNPALMDEAEFKQFLRNVELKSVELAETRQEKMALLKLIEEKRLKKVDNYRRALELPTFNDMTAQQLRDFAKLLEPFQEDDVFLTQRELETVDRTDLAGIRTWREARARMLEEYNKARVERGLEPVNIAELEKVHVASLDSFRWDSSLRERDPFFNILVEQMTTASIGAELKTHEIESKTYELAKKSDKSRSRTISERLIPRDDMIMAFIEAPADQKAAIAQQMTPEQINYANFMVQYFAGILDYLIARKSLERGRQNYFDHVRRTFLEKLRDGDFKGVLSDVAHAKFKSAFTTLFENNIQDQQNFNILDDDTGNILPLEKFIPNVLRRTDVMEPTTNVTRAFLKYVHAAEKMKMYDAIISKLDIYAQSLTPTRYTPRGLEIDRSLKTYVNKWINNKKGRKISFDSVLRQGGPIDVGIRALRTFTTILDLGLSPVAQAAAVIGEQVANAAMLGTRGMAMGTSRMKTDKGKRILKKYEAWVGRSIWEEFTAPGKEITERLSQALFAGFDLATKTANKQFLLASMTDQEFEAEEISTERLAQMRLDMGRFRVVPGTGSLVGSTSVGDAAMQYKKWAVPIARTLIADAETLIGNIKAGQPLDARAGKELMRFAYMSAAVFIVGAMAGADDDDRSVIGKAKGRLYREAMTLMQGIDPTLWLATPRTLTWLYQTAQAFKSMVLMETYKSGDKEGELKGDDKLKRQFVPGVVRSMASED